LNVRFLIKLLFPEPKLGINQQMRRCLNPEPARQKSAEIIRGPGDVALELAVFGGMDVS
jgi:hypothetical protein